MTEGKNKPARKREINPLLGGCLGAIVLFIIVAVVGGIVGFVSPTLGLAVNNFTNTNWIILLPVVGFTIGYFWAKKR